MAIDFLEHQLKRAWQSRAELVRRARSVASVAIKQIPHATGKQVDDWGHWIWTVMLIVCLLGLFAGLGLDVVAWAYGRPPIQTGLRELHTAQFLACSLILWATMPQRHQFRVRVWKPY